MNCKHELEYCPNCDVVRCKVCGKKWGEKEYVAYPLSSEPYDWRGPYRWYYSPNTGDSPKWNGIAITCGTGKWDESATQSIIDNMKLWYGMERPTSQVNG